MGDKYTKAQAAAAKKYHEKFDEIKIRVPKGGKEELQSFVKETGIPSMNDFITQAIEYYKLKINEEIYDELSAKSKQDNKKIIYYRGCEMQQAAKGWIVHINGETRELERCDFEDLMEFIDSIIDS